MTLAQLLTFNAVLLAALLSPGPAMLVAIRTTLAAGRRDGIALGAGLGLVAACWTGLALLGLDGVFSLVPWGHAAAKIAGAVYLLWVAWRIWAGADAPVEGGRVARRAFRDGLLINLLNPKSVLFAAAVLVVVFPRDLAGWEIASIVANHLAVELAFYTGLALVLGTEAVARRYLRAKRWLDRGAAAVLGVLGLRLLVSR